MDVQGIQPYLQVQATLAAVAKLLVLVDKVVFLVHL